MQVNIQAILRHKATLPIAVGIGSVGVGFLVGFVAGRRVERMETNNTLRRIRNRFDIPERLPFDHDAMERFISEQEAQRGIGIPKKDVRNGKPVMVTRVEEIVVEVNTDPEPDSVPQTLFAGDDGDWNYETEIESRTADRPFIIHKDEFFEDSMDYAQSTLTYFSGDDIMADEEETPVYNYLSITGPLRFGHGSQDPNVFYVRNDERKAEYEILFDPGSFSKEILDVDLEEAAEREIRHSQHGVRKFRME
jgi:hypothetical protein